MVTNTPPARLFEGDMRVPMPEAGPRLHPKLFAGDGAPRHGQRGVDELCRQSGKARGFNDRAMDTPFISGRVALAEATDLMSRFGDDAGFEAAARAERSRDNGNVSRFCHWRQIERVIATLTEAEVRGTVH